MDIYNMALIDETFELFNQSLKAGQISLLEYYVEIDALIQKKQDYMQLENKYQKTIAQLYASEL